MTAQLELNKPGTANCFEQSVRAAELLPLRDRLLVRLDRVAGRIVNANLRDCGSRIFSF